MLRTKEQGPEPLWTKADVAAYLKVSSRTVDKYCADKVLSFIQLPSRPIRVDWARRVIQYVGMKDPKDTRLADFFCGAAGFMAVPRIKGKRGEAIQAIMTDIAELAKTGE